MAEEMSSVRDYPTDEELKRIERWESDPWDWLRFIEGIWWMADWGIHWNRNRAYFSTGGWSGNEEIVASMQKNFIMWGSCWYGTRRGGHYVFKLPRRYKHVGRDTGLSKKPV